MSDSNIIPGAKMRDAQERIRIDQRADQANMSKQEKLKVDYAKMLKTASEGAGGYTAQEIEQMRRAEHATLDQQFEGARMRLREMASQRGVLGSSAMAMLESRMYGELASEKALSSQKIEQSAEAVRSAIAKRGIAGLTQSAINTERLKAEAEMAAKARKQARKDRKLAGWMSLAGATGATAGALLGSSSGGNTGGGGSNGLYNYSNIPSSSYITGRDSSGFGNNEIDFIWG